MPKLNKNMTIGDIVKAVPGSEKIIVKYFQGGCHHCPSHHIEPLWLAARMYGHKVEEILRELEILAANPQADIKPRASARERRLAREQARQQSNQ